MDKICNIFQRVTDWVSQLENTPISFMQECFFPINTSPRPCIEFYLICGQDPVKFMVGKEEKIVLPDEMAIVNAHIGNKGITEKWNYYCITLKTGLIPLFGDMVDTSVLLSAPVQNKKEIIKNYKTVDRKSVV